MCYTKLIRELENSYYYFIEHNELIPFKELNHILLEMDKHNIKQICDEYERIRINVPVLINYRNFYLSTYIRLVIYFFKEAIPHYEDDEQNFDDFLKLLLHEWIPLCNDTGLYDDSIVCCEICKANWIYLNSRDKIELNFKYSKAERNKGNYNKALNLLSDIYPYTKNDEGKYYKGATLLRIGKVYQNYLMQEEVAGCFLKEAKNIIEQQLKQTQQQEVIEYLNEQYSICLDALGQFYEKKRNRAELDEALTNYQVAAHRNMGTNRSYRNQAHIIRIQFAQTQKEELSSNEKIVKVQGYIRELNDIIANISINESTHVGLAVRFLQLASMYKYLFLLGDEDSNDSAQSCLNLCIKYSLTCCHYKTLVHANIIKLSGNLWNEVNLDDITKIARKCSFFSYEIELINFQVSNCIETDASKRLQYILPLLKRKKEIYTHLSKLARETLFRYNLAVSVSHTNEFHDLSSDNKNLALNGIINDYSSFIENINGIFEELIDTIQKVL